MPRSRAGKIMWTVVLSWALVAVGLFVKENMAPSPTATIRRDFMVASDWIASYRAEHGRLPSRECFQHFLLRTSLTVPIEYKPTGSGTYSLKGWDGENRWLFLSSTGRTALVTE
jgi:hypothetical protein